jgi:hypothetical protein
MAKGKRGKGGAGGSRSWAGGGGSSGQAQSGGRSTTFQGGKGGTGASSGFGQAGGSNGQGVLGTQVNAAGNVVRVRKPGGDNTPLKGKLPAPGTAHLNTKGKRGGTFFDHVAPTVRGGQARQAGGSTQ